MKINRCCSTCEYNFRGSCTGHGNAYVYGEKITDDTRSCADWGASLEYYAVLIKTAPWYIKKQYEDGKINYISLIEYIDQDELGNAITINLYEAIGRIYGLTTTKLADILNVKPSVIRYAKERGTVTKRVGDFSVRLCIPEQYFYAFTSKDLEALKKCKAEFKKINSEKKARRMFHNRYGKINWIRILGIAASLAAIISTIWIIVFQFVPSAQARDTERNEPTILTNDSTTSDHMVALQNQQTWTQDGMSITLIFSKHYDQDSINSIWQIENTSENSVPLYIDVDSFDVSDAKGHSFEVTGFGNSGNFPSTEIDYVMQPGKTCQIWTSFRYDYYGTSSRDLIISVSNIGPIEIAKWAINVDKDSSGEPLTTFRSDEDMNIIYDPDSTEPTSPGYYIF